MNRPKLQWYKTRVKNLTRDVRFYKRRNDQLEERLEAAYKQIRELGHQPLVPLGKIAGNDVLTDLDAGMGPL